MTRRWNDNVILFWGISRFLSAVCRRWFPGQSGNRTCLRLYKRLVICLAQPFQVLSSACTDTPLTLSWICFSPPPWTPTCHCLHLLIVLSSLFAILWRIFVPTFPEKMLISYFYHWFQLKTSRLWLFIPSSWDSCSSHPFSKPVRQHAELLIVYVNSVWDDSQ